MDGNIRLRKKSIYDWIMNIDDESLKVLMWNSAD